MISSFPIPKAKESVLRKFANLLVLSALFPAIGYLYVRIWNIDPLPGYPLGLILLVIVFYFFFYGGILVYVSGRIEAFFPRIKSVLELDDKQFESFAIRSHDFIFRPSKYLLAIMLVTVPLGDYSVLNSPILRTDFVIVTIISAILLITAFLNWIGAWALIAFFRIVRQFGAGVPVKINPFNPDRLGGLEPVSDLTTLGLLIISVLTAVSIPIWFLFSKEATIVFVVITSILIPLYLYLSMDRLYVSLRNVKQETLVSLAVELEAVVKRVREYVTIEHKSDSDYTKLAQVATNLTAVEKLYNSVSGMRTFPVNTRTMLKVATTTLVPILSLILTSLAQVLWHIIT
jgi:hypothetical protein